MRKTGKIKGLLRRTLMRKKYTEMMSRYKLTYINELTDLRTEPKK